MTQSKQSITTRSKVGDVAVDGLIYGLIAGLLMAGYLVLTGLISGEAAAVSLSRFAPLNPPETAASPLTGALTHLAVAGVYGIVFSLVWQPLRRRRAVPGWLAGLVYGLALWLLAVTLFLPLSGATLGQVPALNLALAHALYGVVLGWLSGRKQQADNSEQ